MLETIVFVVAALFAIFVAVEIIATIGDIITSVITLVGLGVGLLFVADLLGLVEVFDVSLQLAAPALVA